MADPDFKNRAHELRARLDAFRETEALAGVAVDELFTGLKRACACVDAPRPELSGADRLNPQHWGYGLYVYFRDRILIGCTILPADTSEPRKNLLHAEVSMEYPRPLKILTLERTAPSSAEWKSEGRRIEPEAFFLDLLEGYADRWAGE